MATVYFTQSEADLAALTPAVNDLAIFIPDQRYLVWDGAAWVVPTRNVLPSPVPVGAAAATGITQLTGPVTAGPGTGSQASVITPTGVTPGTYGDATHVPQVVVNAAGQVTGVVDVPITASGTGDVVGPASAVDQEIAIFDGTTGKLIEGGGGTIVQVIASAVAASGDVDGPASAVDGHLAVFDGTSGKLLKDGGAVPSGGGGSITQGTYAALPGTCAVGDLYFFTDSVYNCAQCATANVWTLFLNGRIAVAPGPVAGWTGVNTGADWTATDAGGSINAQIIRNGSLNLRGLVKAQPSTPYTVTCFMKAQAIVGSQSAGLCFYDGTKLIAIEWVFGSTPVLRVQRWTNSTSASTTVFTLNNFAGFGNALYGGGFLRIGNTGANLTFDWSLDGIVWTNVYTEAVGAFLTPTHYGFEGVNITTTAGDPLTLSVQSVIVA